MDNPLVRNKRKKVSFVDIPHSSGILDDHAIRKNIASKEGTVEKVPVDNSDIVNKLALDTAIATVPAPALQAVCDVGNTTTTAVNVGSVQFPTSGGYANPTATGLVIAGGDTAGDFMTWSASTVDADSITLTGGAGGVYTTNVTTTYAMRNIYNNLTTGTGHQTDCNALTTGIGYDLRCPAGTSGTGYQVVVDSDVATDFDCIKVLSGSASNIPVHVVDEQGLIANVTAAGVSRWKRRTWKGCTEMETLVGTPIFQVQAPIAPAHYKPLVSDLAGVYYSMQVPHDWDGVSDLNCVMRFLIDQEGGVGAADVFNWNVTMFGGQPFDSAANNGQLKFGTYTPNPNIARWLIHEVSWVFSYAAATFLQAGDTVFFHFYGTQLGAPLNVQSVGIIGSWCEYQSIHPELPTGTT